MLKFEIVKRWWMLKPYHFRIIAQNGRILASSQKYYNLSDVRDAIDLIKTDSYNAPVDLKNDD